MLFHGVSPSQYPHVVERYYPEMKRLQEQGKTRFIGFSEWYHLDPGHRAAELAVKTHPDTPYKHMIDVLDALHTAGAERISLQLLEG